MLPLLQELLLVFTSVLFIVDPFAAVPSFLAMTTRDTTLFALGGSLIFTVFGITIGAFKIAGGVLMGLPLGVPMLAGPGAISTVMVLALGSKGPVTTVALYVAIALTAFVCYVTLSAASVVERRLGQTGMRILTRLMGLVLCAIAAQFIIDGIRLSLAPA